MSQDTFDFDNNAKRTRADQIFERFTKFHNDNPRIWELYKKFAFQLLDRGRERYSAAAIFERIRWHIDIETRTDEPLKLSNDFRAYYGRMFNAVYPDTPLFSVRKLRSESKGAHRNNGIFIDPPPDPERETWLAVKLKRLGQQ